MKGGGEGRTCLVANICLCFPAGASFQRAAGMPHRGFASPGDWKHIAAPFVC